MGMVGMVGKVSKWKDGEGRGGRGMGAYDAPQGEQRSAHTSLHRYKQACQGRKFNTFKLLKINLIKPIFL